MIVKTSASTPRLESARPPRSTRGRRGSPDSGTKASTRPKATSAIGTLSQNAACQPCASSRAPPTIGPSATAMPGHRPPQADRLGPLAALGEQVDDRGQRRGEDRRRAEPRDRTAGDQRAARIDERRGAVRRREEHQPAEQHPPAPEAIGEASRSRARAPRKRACRRRRSTAALGSRRRAAVESVGSATLTIVVSTLTEKAQSSRTARAAARLLVMGGAPGRIGERRGARCWYKNR